MTEGFKICYDRYLKDTASEALKAAGAVAKFWLAAGSTLNVRFLGGTAAQRSQTQEEALWWITEGKANLNLEFNDKPDAEIRVSFVPSQGAWSYVGTDCLGILSPNEPTMNLGFLDSGTAAHEFGHAIGLVHEHQSPKSPIGDKIQWNEPEVFRYFTGEPNFWSEEQIRRNVIKRYSADMVRATEFDRESIMIYWIPDEWLINGKGVQRNEELSEMDKSFVQEIYPGASLAAQTPKKPVELRINGSDTKGEIGKPREEDLFEFTVEQPGNHIIETGGETDLVMKLYGPNSSSNLIATDDDGGKGYNARLVANLAPGRYLVQIRHYNETKGTGFYTLRGFRR